MLTILIWGVIASMADGDSAASRGDHAEAARYYRAVLEEDSSAYEPKYKLARVLSFSGHRDEAIRLYSELLAKSPTNSDVLLGRGRVYSWEGRWKEAEADLSAVTSRSPGYADAWSALGDMYSWSDRPSEAAAAYGRWIESKPDDPNAYIARGKAFRTSGDFTKARADFEAARARGAKGDEIDGFNASLKEKRQKPEAVVPEGFHWSMSASYGMSEFSPERKDKWDDYSISIRRHWDFGSLAVEYLSEDHFATVDDAIAFDAYIDLWKRAYANLRYQYSPDNRLYPDYSDRVELFQGFGKGWEMSGSYDHLQFGESDVDIYAAGLGKYIGNFYIRHKTSFIPSTPTLGISHRTMVRWYYAGNGDDYLEAYAGAGHGGQIRRDGYSVEKTQSRSVGASISRYLTPHIGFKFGYAYSDDKNDFVERGISASLSARW